MKTKGKAYLLKPGVKMKKWILMLMVMLVGVSEMMAKPKLHFEFSGDVVIGRPKKGCKSVWVCIENYSGSVKIELGMIQEGHGVVIEEDGTLYLAINKELLRKQDESKFVSLQSGRLILDDSEFLDKSILDGLGYRGTNEFKAGTYPVKETMTYFLIKLN